MRAFSFLLLGLVTCAAARRGAGPKNAAVDKVIQLMEDLQAKVLEEGTEEAKSYNAFACWCKETLEEKHADIEEAQQEITTLTGRIEDAFASRTEADADIQELTTEIAGLQKKLDKETAAWEEIVAQYHHNEDDVHGGKNMLEKAIEEMKAGCGHAGAVFLQVPESTRKSIKSAMLLADALGFTDEENAAFAQMDQKQDYDCHNQAEIDLLEGMLASFKKKETKLKSSEKQDHFKHEMEAQNLVTEIKAKNVRLEKAKEESGRQTASLTADSEKRTEWNAGLRTDTEFTAAAAKDCQQAAETWDQRSKVRAGELQALTTAIGIVKDKVAGSTSENTVRLVQSTYTVKMAQAVAKDSQMMENLEAEAEAVSFIAISEHVNRSPAGELALNLLRDQGAKLKSTLLTSLANQMSSVDMEAADPFAKIKQLISELINRLLAEAANESNQKAFCDKSMGDAEQKRDNAANLISDLNAAMAKEEADINEYTKTIATVTKKLAKLNNETAEAKEMRDKEKAENTATIEEAKTGKEALMMAYEVLEEFYEKAGKASFAQINGTASVDPRPDMGFKAGESYTGGQGAATGILGMMDVIKSDFVRTIETTEKAERVAADDYSDFMTKATMSINESDEIKKATETNLAETRESHEDHTKDLGEEMTNLAGALEELISLKATCVDTGMSYEERVARREDEIASLKRALCILENQAQGESAAEEC